MLDRAIQAIAGVSRNLARLFPIPVLGKIPRVVQLYLALGIGFTALSVILLWPITGGDYPPGVDTATFLHLSWIADLAVSGQLENPLQDPYWYGGFFYLIYPPLGYGLVGVISAVTSINFVNIYNFLFILSYGAMGVSTWFLAREFGLRWWSAVAAGLLTTIAYPALSSVFLWGWFTSVMAMPFALVSFALLERSLRRHSGRLVVMAGALLAIATLIHHMTSLALVLGLLAWFVYHLGVGQYSRRDLVIHSLIYSVTTAIIIAPWAIPFLLEASNVGFRREIPGNWLPTLGAYRANILDPSLIGGFIYPSYLGIVPAALALAGVVIALIERHRMAGAALILLVMVWFSMGAKANPLIRYYPLSSLDVARFQLYVVPFMALLAAMLVEHFLSLARETWPQLRLLSLWRPLVVTTLVLVLAYPVYNAWQARSLAHPYQVQPQVQQALNWLATTPPNLQGKPASVFSIGLWNWHSFLVPALAHRPLVDGWHDEGAANNVRLIRRLRGMAWIGGDPVDPVAAHQILTALGADYVLLHRAYWSGERAAEFWDQLERNPDRFSLRERWGDVGVFQVLKTDTPRL